jgi:hypothetical protein
MLYLAASLVAAGLFILTLRRRLPTDAGLPKGRAAGRE